MPLKKKKKVNKHNTKFEKNLSISSRRYLERQARDQYSTQAQQEGYRSRAVYKLKEINDKYNVIKNGGVIIDLGAAPGSWSQMAVRLMDRSGTVIALDKIEIDQIPGVEFLCGDFTTDECYEDLQKITPEGVDAVLSDMAPETCGNASLDHLRIMHLAELAADFAEQNLKPGGSFICKLFMGGEEKAFSERLRKFYDKVAFVKPSASRADSREIFIVGIGFKG
jgi:23S rRNA (uridine2552-2'-O)-methyltransferase